MIDLSASQQAALERVRAWLADPRAPGATREPGVFRFFGPAGSGKSTLAVHAAAAAGGAVRYAAFTGKAAHVMRAKGCEGASTVHKLIYRPRQQCTAHLRELAERLRAEPDADRRRELQAEHDEEMANLRRPSWTLNTTSDLRDAALLVLDEVSMIGETMGRDLLSFEVPILALGDPSQLPPVGDRGYFTDPRQTPDLLLEEVHRQAAGSPVLALATRVRRGEAIDYGRDENEKGLAEVVRRRDVKLADAASAFDQVVCGRNATRRALNRQLREALLPGADPLCPVPGDRLVCLRNDHDVGLLNGAQWRCLAAERLDADRAILAVREEGGEATVTVESHLQYFRGDQPKPYEVRSAQCFDFAYALTAHKSQGSGWPSVCVVDESRDFGPDARRWLYTAVTRASRRVTVIR